MNVQTIFWKKISGIGMTRIVGLLAGLVLLAGMFAGCVSRREDRAMQKLVEEPVLPPSFLSGPAGALLTNNSGFSATVTLELPSATDKSRVITGQLLGQGSHLVFAPAGGDKTFIWNVSDHSGWVFSEALQGYAPVSTTMQITSVANISETAGPRGREAEVSVTTDDGSVSKFNVWRASALNGLPAQIKMLSVPGQPVINLSNVRLETLPANLFLPPEGFTHYSSPEMMSSELIMRKSKLKTRNTEKLGEPLPLPSKRAY